MSDYPFTEIDDEQSIPEMMASLAEGGPVNVNFFNLLTCHKGEEPPVTWPCMFWADTGYEGATNYLYQRNITNTAWDKRWNIAGGGTHNAEGLSFLPPVYSALTTISGGVLPAPDQAAILVETQGGAASDDLDTINIVTGVGQPNVVILRPYSDSHTVVVKHNTGNIWNPSGADISLDDIRDAVLLWCDGTKWIVIGWAAAGGGDFKADGSIKMTGALQFDSHYASLLRGLTTSPTASASLVSGVAYLDTMVTKIDTESGAASDDLDTISVLNGVSHFAILMSTNNSRTVVVKHNTGNIYNPAGADISLDNTTKLLLLIYNGVASKWVVVGSTSSAGSGDFKADGSVSMTGDLDFGNKIGKNLAGVLFKATTELTIATGAITVAQSLHTVDTESDAASDELDTINGGTTINMIILRAENNARTVVIKHNTGNIWNPSGQDITLDDIRDAIMLWWDGTKWIVIGWTGGGQVVTIPFIIDGGGAAITTGIKGDLMVNFPCEILAATLLADTSGSIVVDIWKDSYANYPPTVADTITASAKPTISSAVKAQDTTLTGWTKTIAAGETLRYNVDSCTTITRCLVALKVRRT